MFLSTFHLPSVTLSTLPSILPDVLPKMAEGTAIVVNRTTGSRFDVAMRRAPARTGMVEVLGLKSEVPAAIATLAKMYRSGTVYVRPVTVDGRRRYSVTLVDDNRPDPIEPAPAVVVPMALPAPDVSARVPRMRSPEARLARQARRSVPPPPPATAADDAYRLTAGKFAGMTLPDAFAADGGKYVGWLARLGGKAPAADRAAAKAFMAQH